MNKILLTILLAVVLSGCAHKELKAPCTNIAALAPGTTPCDQRQPINAMLIPTTFAQ